MKTHINNPSIYHKGFSTLSNITNYGKNLFIITLPINPFSITAGNQKKAGDLETIEFILNSMRNFNNDSKVCYNGLKALSNITMNSKKTRSWQFLKQTHFQSQLTTK